MGKKIVFDFDGTLITVNSFPLWVKYLLRHSLCEFKWIYFIRIIILILKRKVLRLSSHEEFKRDLILLDTPSFWTDGFATLLAEKCHSDVLGMAFEKIAQGDQVIISSAAPKVYLTPVVEKIFSEKSTGLTIIGAEIINGVLNENYKEAKLQNLYEKGLLGLEEKLDCLYTDSYDDLPLAIIANQFFLVCPDSKTLSYFSGEEWVGALFCLID